MGVLITSREYDNRYRPEKVDWLIGNVGDWQQLRLISNFSVEKKFTTGTPLVLENDNDLVTSDASHWSESGFDSGDVVVYQFRMRIYDTDGTELSNTIETITRNAIFVQGDRMTLDGAPINTASFSYMPYQSASTKIDQVIVYSDKQPEGAIITYGHLQNEESDSKNLNSFIDGTKTRFSAIGMDSIIGWVPMEPMGKQSGMSIRSAQWQYITKIGTHTYQYYFDIEFMLSSFFEDLTNLETFTAPSQVFDAASLTDNFEVVGFPEWNNPNTQMVNDLEATKRKGNTGWFGENFNGLKDNFTVSSVEYFDVATGEELERLSYGDEVKVRAVIEGVANMADGLTKCGIGFIWTPENEDYYKEKETPFHQNLLVNTAGGYGSGVFVLSPTPSVTTYQGFTNNSDVRMDVRNVHFYQSGADMIYEAIWSPTVGFKNFMEFLPEGDRNYALWVSVADRTEETNFSDRVSKLVDYNSMELYIPPVGEWEGMTIELFEHYRDGSETSRECDSTFFVEDDILAKVRFNVDVNDVVPNAINFVIETENINDGRKFELQSFKVDLSGYPLDSNGVPQWNYDETRGFKLVEGNNKNWVKVQRDETGDTISKYGYIGYFAFKIRWEDWIFKTGVPSDFYDENELNNGFNNDWFHYLSNPDWKMNFCVYLDAVKDSQSVRYNNHIEFDFSDFESNDELSKTWSYYRQSDNTLINGGIDPETGKLLGIIVEGEKTRVQVLYNRTDGGFWSNVSDIYGTICIEINKGPGQFQLRQLSSVYERESDNPLVPLDGETKLKITLLSSTSVRFECLIDSSLLDESYKYKLSSRLGCLI